MEKVLDASPSESRINQFRQNDDSITSTLEPEVENPKPLSAADYIQKITIAFETFNNRIEPGQDPDLPHDPNDPTTGVFRRTGWRNVMHNYANLVQGLMYFSSPTYNYVQSKMEIIEENGPQHIDEANIDIHQTFAKFGQSLHMFRTHAKDTTALKRFEEFNKEIVTLTKHFISDKEDLALLPTYLQAPIEDNNQPVPVKHHNDWHMHLN